MGHGDRSLVPRPSPCSFLSRKDFLRFVPACLLRTAILAFSKGEELSQLFIGKLAEAAFAGDHG